MKYYSNLIKPALFKIGLVFSIILSLMVPVQYAHAEDDAVLGCFITLTGKITFSNVNVVPQQTKISIFDAYKPTAPVKEVVVQDGKYELNLDPGEYRIFFAAEGYTTHVSEVISVNREKTYEYNVELLALSTIDTDNQTIYSGKIYINAVNEESGELLSIPATSPAIIRLYKNDTNELISEQYSDASGNYSIALPQGKYKLAFSMEGFRDVLYEKIEVGEETKAESLDVTFDPIGDKNPLYGSVLGRMIDHKGRYFKGFDVIARRISVDDKSLINDGNDTDAYTTTDKTGNWELELEPGRYQITCWGASYSTEHVIVDVYKNQVTMVGDVVINSNTQGIGYKPITIKVQNVLTGEPIPNALIYFRQDWNTKNGNVYYMRSNTGSKYQFYTDADGVLETGGIRSQEYCVEISAPGYRTGYFNVVCCENEEYQYCCLAPYQ